MNITGVVDAAQNDADAQARFAEPDFHIIGVENKVLIRNTSAR